jgi:hypothetical protein
MAGAPLERLISMVKKSKSKKQPVGRDKWRSTAVLDSVAVEFEEWNAINQKYTGLTSFLSESGRLRLAELKRANVRPAGRTDGQIEPMPEVTDVV